MLKKLNLLFCAAVLTVGFVGCAEVGTSVEKAADSTKEGVDSAADATKEAADGIVPESAKDTVDGAVDKTGEATKEGIDAAAGAASGS